jgi:hypothetical protein
LFLNPCLLLVRLFLNLSLHVLINITTLF